MVHKIVWNNVPVDFVVQIFGIYKYIYYRFYDPFHLYDYNFYVFYKKRRQGLFHAITALNQ